MRTGTPGTLGCAALVAALWLGAGAFAGVLGIHNLTTATSYPSIQAAVSAAASGDVIHVGPGQHFEDNIDFPIGIDFTLRGSPTFPTQIIGSAVSDANPVFRMSNTGQTAAMVIQDLTILGSINTNPLGGAVVLVNTHPTFRRVAFVNCRGPAPDSGAACILANGCNSRFESCTFRASSEAFDGVTFFNSSNPVFLQCLWSDNDVTVACSLQNGTVAQFTNCTFVAANQALRLAIGDPSLAQLWNCIIIGAQNALGGGAIDTAYCLFPGAAGSSVDGLPTFVDGPGGDYRLAPGSLGIDGADARAYIGAGGGPQDLGGFARSNNDAGVVDTGIGPFTFLDIGAFEFQESTPSSCPWDLNGSGHVSAADLAQVLGSWGPCP